MCFVAQNLNITPKRLVTETPNLERNNKQTNTHTKKNFKGFNTFHEMVFSQIHVEAYLRIITS